MALAMAAAAAGCKTPPQNVAVDQHRPPPDADREPLALIPAARCGECHGKMEQEWRRSPHARADGSPLYRAMLARAGAAAAQCQRCHAPLRKISPGDPTTAEGVTCDVCHTLASVQLGREGGGGFVLHPEDSIRYGPLCDAKPHYFHTMGCSPLHQEGTFCAACHDLRQTLPGGGALAVYSEYGEWREGAAASDGRTCQECHMPGDRAELAVGSPARESVRSHAFALRGALLGRALSGRASVSAVAGKLRVAVSLSNTGAGHAVPSGLPGRQLVVAVETVDAAGRVLASQEHSYGRVLVDAAEHEVPYYAAVRERADTRIRVGETRQDAFELAASVATTAPAAPAAAALRVRVSWRSLSPALAAQLGIAASPDEPMLAASLPLPLPARPAGPAVLQLAP